MRNEGQDGGASAETGPDVWTFTGRGEARDKVRFAMLPDMGVAVVAEGFGSFSGGGLAAELVVDLLPVHLKREAPPEPPWLGMVSVTAEHIARAVASVADRIHAASQLDAFYGGMGASFAAVILRSNDVLVAHLGDCLVLRARGTEVERLTSPHTHSADPRLLTRALGIPNSTVDIAAVPVLDGDVFVLCKGDVAATMETRIRDHFDQSDPDVAAERLDAVIASSCRGGYVTAVAHKTQSLNPLRRAVAWSGVAPTRGSG